MASSFLGRERDCTKHFIPLFGPFMLHTLASVQREGMMTEEERIMALATLIDQQIAFISKFRDIFRNVGGSPHGQNQLPVQLLQVLLVLYQEPGIIQAELARKVGLSTAAVGRHLKDLRQERNLVWTEVNPVDAKEKLCYLTPTGEALMREMLAVFLPRRTG